MEKKISKKETILNAALKLFSEKGYDGVGVDEIAETVGMKGPALYHYFKGKDALLEELLSRTEEYYNANFGAAGRKMPLPDTNSAFIAATKQRLAFTMHDPVIKSIRRMMNMEQFRNARIAEQTTKHQLTGVESLNRVCIEHLIAAGQLKDMGAEAMAFAFTAPVTVLIQIADREPAREEEVQRMIDAHLDHFVKVYGTEQSV